jgi:hypothetical protein
VQLAALLTFCSEHLGVLALMILNQLSHLISPAPIKIYQPNTEGKEIVHASASGEPIRSYLLIASPQPNLLLILLPLHLGTGRQLKAPVY